MKLLKTFFKKEEKDYKKPVLKLFSTVVPQSFLKANPHWDTHLYTKQEIINDSK